MMVHLCVCVCKWIYKCVYRLVLSKTCFFFSVAKIQFFIIANTKTVARKTTKTTWFAHFWILCDFFRGSVLRFLFYLNIQVNITFIGIFALLLFLATSLFNLFTLQFRSHLGWMTNVQPECESEKKIKE